MFVFGMIFKKAPAAAGVTGLLLSVPVYGFLHWQFGGIAFLNRMAVTFGVILLVMLLMTLKTTGLVTVCIAVFTAFVARDFLQWQLEAVPFINAVTAGIFLVSVLLITCVKPLAEPKVMPVREEFDMRPTPCVLWLGVLVIAATLVLYAIFW